jgi:hypothetical protein
MADREEPLSLVIDPKRPPVIRPPDNELPAVMHPNEVRRRIRDEYRRYTLDALAVIVEVLKDESEKGGTRLKAAELILERAWGKAGFEPDIDRASVMREGIVAARERISEAAENGTRANSRASKPGVGG